MEGWCFVSAAEAHQDYNSSLSLGWDDYITFLGEKNS